MPPILGNQPPISSERLPNAVAVDTETNGLSTYEGHHMFAAAATFMDGRSLFWRDEFSGLKELCEDPTLDKVFHNAKFDIKMLAAAGIGVRGRIHDTMVLAHLTFAGWDKYKRQPLKLEELAIKYLPASRRKVLQELDDWFDSHKVAKKHRGRHFADLPPVLLKKRCIGDTQLTLLLYAKLYPYVLEHHRYMLDIEERLIPILVRLEDRGLLIDPQRIQEQMEVYGVIVDDVVSWCEGVVGHEGFNINSPTHAEELFTQVGTISEIPKHAKTGNYKFDDMTLRALHHPASAMILVGRAASKMRSTFLAGMLDRAVDNIVHASFNQVGTITGRFSCSGPNLQNIPLDGTRRAALTDAESDEQLDLTEIDYVPQIKHVFPCPPGYCRMHSDKAKAEMYALGHYTRDPVLFAALQEEDVHTALCQFIFGTVNKGLRVRTKVVLFSYLYGAGLKLTARKMGATLEEARELRERVGAKVPGLDRWKHSMNKTIAEQSYVETIHGRYHYIPSDKAYQAVSRMCQGTIGDEIKCRMVIIGEFLFNNYGLDAMVVTNIHDDLGIDIPIPLAHELVPPIYKMMNESEVDLWVPIPSSCELTATRWSELHEVEFDPATGEATNIQEILDGA